MKINPKSQKGAITLIVLVTMLFLTAFLMSMYIGIANKAGTSAETTKQIAEKYNNLEEANAIYDSYFANSDVIPIYTREHLEKIGSGEQIGINGKIYTFSKNGYYTLQNDLDLGGYYDETTKTWTASTEEEWLPLPLTDSTGNQYKFTGTLDGLGNTITGMYINKPTVTNLGLFGTLDGTVKNLRIVNGYINGQSNIGGIAGKNNGTIKNCYDTAIILALSSDNGKVQVDGIWYESVEDYMNGQPILINFTIDSVKYSAPQGMDWEAWCLDEEYNKLGEDAFTKSNETDNVFNSSNFKLLDSAGTEVTYPDLIKSEEAYQWEQQSAY